MISSTTWTRLVLLPATLHSVSSVAPCCRVAWHCSGARRVVHRVGATLQSNSSYLSICAARPELLNHSVLWQPTMSALRVCAVLAQSYNPPAHTSC
jgi:hypothetical protein